MGWMNHSGVLAPPLPPVNRGALISWLFRICLRWLDLRTEMAQASVSVTESQFRCPICLDMLKDPVSIPCGHTYCMVCINNYWDQAGSGPFSCPQCREPFSPRPVLRRNTVLAEVVDKLKLSEMLAAPELYVGGAGEVPCDFCPAESTLRAAASCLVCLASLCELHVLPHREVGALRRHKLVAAVERVAERLCAQHRVGLAPAGGAAGEWDGDCLLCEADQEEVRNVDAQRARRQVELTDTQYSVVITKVGMVLKTSGGRCPIVYNTPQIK